ncbi:hypothetical protein [Ferrovibrio sp.]|uniref:hypothetical protein n=1 Tax=Ferrovibrio sp. TaxID=1917215 RepID=UPI003D0FCF3E
MADPVIPGDIICTCKTCVTARQASQTSVHTFQLTGTPPYWTCNECGRKVYSHCNPNGPAICDSCAAEPGWHLAEDAEDDEDDDYEPADD